MEQNREFESLLDKRNTILGPPIITQIIKRVNEIIGADCGAGRKIKAARIKNRQRRYRRQ